MRSEKGGGTVSSTSARYTKIGDLVTVAIMIQGSGGSGSGDLILTSLPFASQGTPSSYRAAGVTRALIKRGVRPSKISTVFYGDTRLFRYNDGGQPDQVQSRRVEFLLRKTDLRTPGQKVESQ